MVLRTNIGIDSWPFKTEWFIVCADKRVSWEGVNTVSTYTPPTIDAFVFFPEDGTAGAAAALKQWEAN